MKTPLDPNADGRTIQLRPGFGKFAELGVYGWRGVNSEDDPGSTAVGDLLRGLNMRQQGRRLYTRPGLVEVANFGTGRSITWGQEEPSDNPAIRIWVTTFGCMLGASSVGGSQCAYCDPTANPTFQIQGNYRAANDRNAGLMKYSGHLYLGDKTALREILAPPVSPGVEILSLSPSPPQTPTIDFPGYTIICGMEFDGKLFLSLLSDTLPDTTSKIVYWNGLSYVDDLTGIAAPVAFGIWQNKLVAGFPAATAGIKVRNAGAAPGTWSTVNLAGMVTAQFGNAMQEYGPDLYIASGTNLIHKYNGSALSLVRTVAGAAVDGFGVTALTLHHGLLYYGWNAAGPTYVSTLGRHDRESTGANEWVDSYRTLTAAVADFSSVCTCLSYREQIYLGGKRAFVIATATADVQGSLEIVNDTGSLGTGHAILHMLRFP